MKVLIYLQEKNLAPKGGPNAVGYYIYLNAKEDKSADVQFLDTIETKSESKFTKLLKKAPKWILNIYRKHKRIKAAKNVLNVKSNENIDFNKFDIVHFHNTFDLYKEREALKNFKGKVVLTSHSPVPTWLENISDLTEKEVKKYKKWYDQYKIIDEYAFDHTDFITFPCEEAEEPYYENWDKYAQIHDRNKNKYKYILTGIPACHAKKSKEEVLKNYALEKCEFLVSYVGRHNRVKGYDNLKLIAENVFKEHEDIDFIIAGKEYPLQGLNHKQWHEIGWTNDPHSIISASDVFVLPNKATYFDIVMLEILSLGKIVIASRTGGNKYFEKLNPKGIFLYDTLEEAKKILLKIKNLSTEERTICGNDNKRIFVENFTDKIFYKTYIDLLNSILK